ncbi:MAG: TdeIII family type II restriction endonuclease [Deltaproteobacteria bacterium]|nr:TdeIII family type II restriction endonuclease [Deltaproteobacteria bacterium]
MGCKKKKASQSFLAFPYNPYHPEPYSRFTEVGMMNHPNDFLIGEEYWDLLGGRNTFPELLDVFDKVGKTFKEKLQNKFKQVANEKLDSY